MSSHLKLSRENHSGESANGMARYIVPNVDKALTILELLSAEAEGLTVAEIVRELDLSKTTVFRIIQTLLVRGYLEQEDDSKKLTLSPKLLSLGYAAVSDYNLLEKALDVMRNLRDELRETILIGTIVDGELVVLEQVLGLHPFKFMIDVGMHTTVHSNAPGKCILAFLPTDQQEKLLGRIRLHRYTDTTITSRAGLRKELAAIRSQGYATDLAEEIDGVHCVAAPIFDRRNLVVAAIWATGPKDRLKQSSFPQIAQVVIRHARQISKRLGCPAG